MSEGTRPDRLWHPSDCTLMHCISVTGSVGLSSAKYLSNVSVFVLQCVCVAADLEFAVARVLLLGPAHSRACGAGVYKLNMVRVGIT